MEKIDTIVEKIKNEEETKYGISINIATITPIKYFKKALGTFSLQKVSEAIKEVRNLGGYYDPVDEYICLFNKNYEFKYFMHNPYDYVMDKHLYFSKEEIIVNSTYHEIRHVVQHSNKDMFSDYERFCMFYLDEIDDDKYRYDADFHDRLYRETDAISYAYKMCQEHFKYSDERKEYYQKAEGTALLLKNIYPFDILFDEFCKNLKKHGIDNELYYGNVLEVFWNKDGTLKELSQIMKNEQFNSNIDSLLTSMILSSDAFLETIDTNNLTKEEKEILIYAIDNNILFTDHQKENIDDLYKQGKIYETNYDEALSIIDKKIMKKEEKKELLKEKSRK